MDKKARSIDGILLRPSKSSLRLEKSATVNPNKKVTLDNVNSTDLGATIDLSFSKKQRVIKRPKPKTSEGLDSLTLIDDDIDNSLNELNEDFSSEYNDIPSEKEKEKKLMAVKKIKPNTKKPKKKRKALRAIIITIVILFLAVGGFIAFKLITAGNSIFDGNIMDLFRSEKLLQDANGRSNILVFGTTPPDDDGPLLADTIMVLSINQTDKTAYTISLPRDLYVEHYCPNPYLGTSAGKINETYKCVYDEAIDNEAEASNEFRKVVGGILGLDVQYYTHLSYDGVMAIIDSVGGVDITIESEDPRGIYDFNTGIKFANGEEVHLNGEDALRLARSRGAGGGYGFESFGGSNYFRERSQQKILKALQAKATSSGILSNPIAALDILTALGNNLRTNFKTSEVRALLELANEFNSDNIISIPLCDEENNVNLIVSSMVGDASVEIPVAGMFNYSAIQKYIAKKLSSDPVIIEAAVIDVLNGSDIVGLAGIKADELQNADFIVGAIDNAPDGQYSAIEIYQINAAKKSTADALKKKFDVSIKTDLPAGIQSTADFVIIFGS